MFETSLVISLLTVNKFHTIRGNVLRHFKKDNVDMSDQGGELKSQLTKRSIKKNEYLDADFALEQDNLIRQAIKKNLECMHNV